MKAYIVEKAALSDNIRLLREKAGSTPIYGVIKGNGYGLGVVPMAQMLRQGGIDRFAVTEVSEVRALRQSGFETEEILMLRATCLQEELEELLELNAVATVGSLDCANAMAAVAEAKGTVFPCHIKIDTGMSRYGFFPEDIDTLAQVYAMESLSPRGIYTHFHSAFCSEAATRAQFAAFQQVCDTLSERGIAIGIRHCCNSCAFLQYPEMHLDAVRIGSALLGRIAISHDVPLHRIGWCEAQVEMIRQIPAGHTVGYGTAWKAKRPTTIAVCGVGYLHGFGSASGDDIFRLRDCLRGAFNYVRAFLKKKAFYIQINGTPARVLGHIGMVQTICDVTGQTVAVGDPIRVEINPLMLHDMEIIYR